MNFSHLWIWITGQEAPEHPIPHLRPDYHYPCVTILMQAERRREAEALAKRQTMEPK
jgi:hypothetical protein